MPFFIDRLHEQSEKRGDWIANWRRRHRQESLRGGNIDVSREPEEPILPGVIEVLGGDFILSRTGTATGRRAPRTYARGDINAAAWRKLGGDNTKRFYGLVCEDDLRRRDAEPQKA